MANTRKQNAVIVKNMLDSYTRTTRAGIPVNIRACRVGLNAIIGFKNSNVSDETLEGVVVKDSPLWNAIHHTPLPVLKAYDACLERIGDSYRVFENLIQETVAVNYKLRDRKTEYLKNFVVDFFNIALWLDHLRISLRNRSSIEADHAALAERFGNRESFRPEIAELYYKVMPNEVRRWEAIDLTPPISLLFHPKAYDAETFSRNYRECFKRSTPLKAWSWVELLSQGADTESSSEAGVATPVSTPAMPVLTEVVTDAVG